MLRLDNVGVFAGAERPLSGVSLEAQPGELLALIGPNGGGKSTTLKTIAGLLRPSRGTLTDDGADITGQRLAERRAAGFRWLGDAVELVPGLTAGQHLDLVIRDPSDRARLVAQLPELADVPLSRRAAGLDLEAAWWLHAALGLAAAPRWLLVDEPGLGLSAAIRGRIWRRLRELAGAGMGVIVATSQTRPALAAAQRAYVLENGRVTMSGPAAELRALPRLRDSWMAA